jgi:hypothetical protein
MAAIDLKKAVFTIKDGASSEVTVKIGEGNLTFSEKRTMDYVLDRGVIDTVKEGDEVPVEVKFDFMWEYIAGTSSASGLIDAIKGTSPLVSTDTDACRPFACDLELVYSPTPVTCGDKETITFPDFRWESLEYDLKAATISCSGKCNVTEITTVRETQTPTSSPSRTPSRTPSHTPSATPSS